MSKIGVSLKLDVSKIDKARLFKGEKGTYLDATVFVDLDNLDQYGNSGMITQDVTKYERAQKVQGAILGNAKIFYADGINMPTGGEQQTPPPQAPNQAPAPDDFSDSIPF